MTTYVPGTLETDPKKQNMSLQQIGPKLDTAITDIATLNAATYVNSFNTRTGAVVPVQGDYSTSLIPGTTTNDSATAGNIGEYIESIIASGSAVALTNATAKTVTSISLTAGDWDVSANIGLTGGATTTVGTIQGSISLTTNTTDLTVGRSVATYFNSATVFANTPIQLSVAPVRISLASTTSVFLVGFAGFGVSTLSAYGIIRARRVR
jgi:hypothetical protein